MLEGISTIIFDLGGTIKIEGIWEWHHDYTEIERLAEKYKIVIAANQPTSAREFIEKSAIGPCVSAIYLSWEINLHKPNPKFFEYILADLKLKPSEAVYVGNDYINDIWPTKKLGVRNIFVKRPIKLIWIKNLFAKLFFIKPNYVIRNLYELK